MSSTLPTEKTSSNAAVEVVAVLEGLSRVSAEGFLGLRPLFRLVGSRPILEIQMLRMKEREREREREIQWDNEKEVRKELQRERERKIGEELVGHATETSSLLSLRFGFRNLDVSCRFFLM